MNIVMKYLLEGVSKPVAEVAKLPKRRNSCEFRYGESVLKCHLPLLVIAICLSAVAVQAQQPRSLDDELLEDLGTDPLDEFDRELFTPGEGQGRAGRPRDEDLPDAGQRNNGTGVTIEHDNPLVEISRRMREAQRLIGRNDSGSTTQALQEQVVADLDKLIEQARKACKKCSPGDKQPQGVSARKPVGQPPKQPGNGQKPSDKPATNSSPRPKGNGQAAKVDVEAVRDVIKALWGELPQNEREQMLQLPIEEFLPKYELLIEEYFRRLSEEK